jgi:hypothetical protein
MGERAGRVCMLLWRPATYVLGIHCPVFAAVKVMIFEVTTMFQGPCLAVVDCVVGKGAIDSCMLH